VRREMFHEALQATQGGWMGRLWGNGAPERIRTSAIRGLGTLSCSSERHHAKQPSFVWLPRPWWIVDNLASIDPETQCVNYNSRIELY
jgi:hypothetical protein